MWYAVDEVRVPAPVDPDQNKDDSPPRLERFRPHQHSSSRRHEPVCLWGSEVLSTLSSKRKRTFEILPFSCVHYHYQAQLELFSIFLNFILFDNPAFDQLFHIFSVKDFLSIKVLFRQSGSILTFAWRLAAVHRVTSCRVLWTTWTPPSLVWPTLGSSWLLPGSSLTLPSSAHTASWSIFTGDKSFERLNFKNFVAFVLQIYECSMLLVKFLCLSCRWPICETF